MFQYTSKGPINAPILIFIHGWPDTGDLWKKQVAHFSHKYQCVCVTWPAFGAEVQSTGFDFPELVEQLAVAIDEVVGTSKQPVILVGHDWGAFLTYLFDQKYPLVASRLITMDVGGHFNPSSLGHTLFLLTYQWWLVAAFAIGKGLPFVGNAMARVFSQIAKAPRGADVYARMNYPYFYFWRARLFKKYKNSLPQKYKPTKPILYLYGMDKKYHFHSKKWEQIVTETSGSKVVGIPAAGHWFMRQDAAATNAAIESWL